MRIVYQLLPAAVALLASAWACGDTTTAFEREVTADPKGVVDVTSTAGTVDITAWDRAAVGVKAQLGSEVDHVEVTSSGNHTVVRVQLKHHAMGFEGGHEETHLRVQVPKESEVDASTVSANLTSSGVQGIQRLKSVSGDITADIGPSDFDAKSVSGTMKLHGHGQPARLHVSTVSGDIDLKHAAGELEATSVSGEVSVEVNPARSARLRSTSGDITFDGRLLRGADFDAVSVNGDLKVRAPSEDGFQYEVQSLTGDIRDCFNVKAERSSEYGPGEKLNGTRGAGGGHVRLKTMSGEIDLCDQ